MVIVVSILQQCTLWLKEIDVVYIYWSITTLALSAIGPLIIAANYNKLYWMAAVVAAIIGAWAAGRTERCEYA